MKLLTIPRRPSLSLSYVHGFNLVRPGINQVPLSALCTLSDRDFPLRCPSPTHNWASPPPTSGVPA